MPGLGAFTCIGWQVTVCDPVWQVMFRSSEMSSHEQLYASFMLPFSGPHYGSFQGLF